MNDRFHYDALVDDALRSVVRRVLVQVAEKGLPGSHHFYISFRSNDPGVQGTRAMFEMLAAEPRLTATAIQTVGSKGYDGFALAVVTKA